MSSIADSTLTRGASMAHGSVSAPSMLLGMTAVLANGTVARLTPAAYPALWRAFAVSAGRLG